MKHARRGAAFGLVLVSCLFWLCLTGPRAWAAPGSSAALVPAQRLGPVAASVNPGSTAHSGTNAAHGAGVGSAQGATSSAAGTPLDLPATTLPSASGPNSFDSGSLLLLAGKFGIVLILLFLSLRVLKVVLPGGRSQLGGRNGPMVLHSENIGDKQRVCLLDLHSSIVVVGVSPAGISPITTVTDVEEVDRLRARYRVQVANASPRELGRRRGMTGVPAKALPTFASALEAETEADRTFSGESIVRSVVGATRARARKPFATATSGGDPVLDQALERMRSLRQRIGRA
jgi:flagellar biogenesis protein FliO